MVTMTGRKAVDRYEARKSTAAAAHFDMGLYIVESGYYY